jgi:hypothetical protein
MSESGDYTPGDELAYEVQKRKPNEPLSDYLIAVIAHEANRIYCAEIGDYSQVPWLEAPQWQRASAIKGVAFVRANPDASPSASHESWLEEKRATGWVYGPEKNPETKTHPCFVPYDELPLDQRRKDALFQGIARAMIAE